MIAPGSRPPSRLVLLGHPLGHTLSPLLHGAALSAAGLTTTYHALDVAPDDLDEALARLVAERAAGNVTIPHKRSVASRCARRTSVAERAGAVNTFWCEGGALAGDNTDVGGFDAAARALLGAPPDGQRVAILGAGGAAAGVLAAVEQWIDARVLVWSRSAERASALAARFPVATAAPTLDVALGGATLVVNATPVGLGDDAHPVSPSRLAPNASVLDLVYKRGETSWVRGVRASGRPASDGLPMLVEQAALAFECWFGVSPDREAMWSAVGGRPAWMRDGSIA